MQAPYRDRSVAYSKFICGDMSGKGKRGNRVKEIPSTPSSNPQVTVNGILQDLSQKNKDVNRSAFLGFLQTLIGAEVDVNLIDGTISRGIFYTSTPFEGKKLEIVLKYAKKVDGANSQGGGSNGSTPADVGASTGATMIVPFEQIKLITALKSKFPSTSQGKELETDATLSRRSNLAELEGRDLQSLDSSWLTPETNAQLDSRQHSLGAWNQFEANKKLYNFQETYDENIYTKRLDRSQLTREQLARADSLANQIESSTTTNFHLREERGQISTGEEENYDEEDRYSGVLRQNSPGGNTSTRSAAVVATNSKQPKNSPTAAAGGSWRRVHVPVLSPSTPTSSSASSAPPTVSTAAPSAWGQKPSYAAAAGKNAQPAAKAADPSLPPGFGAAPPTEGGYFKSNIETSNVDPNISFYGTASEASVASATAKTSTATAGVATKAESAAVTSPATAAVAELNVPSAASAAKAPEAVDVPTKTPEPVPAAALAPTAVTTPPVVTPAPKKTPSPPVQTTTTPEPDATSTGNQTPLSSAAMSKPGTPSDTSSVTSASKGLRATAAEWKPPSSSSTPNSTAAVTTTPTAVASTQGNQGNSGGGYSNNNFNNQRPNNRGKSRNNNNNNYRNGGGGGNYQQHAAAANGGYDQANMYAASMAAGGYYDPSMQMYQPQYHPDMGVGGGVFMQFDPVAAAAAGGYMYPAPQFYVQPPFDPSGYPPQAMFPVYPDPMMQMPPPNYYHTHTELVVGMDHAANHGVAVAPGLSDMGGGGMKGDGSQNNDGN